MSEQKILLSQECANDKAFAIIKILNDVSHLQSQQILSSVKNALDSSSVVKEELYSQSFNIESKVAKS